MLNGPLIPRSGGKNEEKIFVSSCLCARHDPAMTGGSAQGCPDCPKWGKPALREWKARKGAKWKV